MFDALLKLDRALFLAVNSGARSPVLDWIMPALSDWKFTWLPLAVVLLFFLRRRPLFLLWVLVAVGAAVALGDALTTYVLKPFFERPRPFAEFRNILVFKGHWASASTIPPHETLSFPSAHAVNSAAAAFMLGRYFPRWRLPAALAVFFVCYSRVYLGVHYPSDTLGGIVFGAAVASLVLLVETLARKTWPGRLPWLENEARA